tara:strand:- start:8301 stop:10073 length:1773 start_codon:yes stop_codon:yes gene_type:complete
MSIILRTNKGSALSYDEMDRNQAQFFYSSSKSPDGLKLRLHYTGSDNLDTTVDFGPTRYHEVSFPVFESEVPDSNVAGDNTQIQFNTTTPAGSSNFDADSLFVFTNSNHSVGIGTSTPQQRLDIQGDGQRSGTVALRGSVNHDGLEQGRASVEFYKGTGENNLLGQIGRIEYANSGTKDDIFIHAGETNTSSGFQQTPDTPSTFHISLGALSSSTTPHNRIGITFKRPGTNSTARVGINNTAPPVDLSIIGQSGLGVSHTNKTLSDHSIIKPINSTNGFVLKTNGFNQRLLFPNDAAPEGIQISTPSTANGGSVLVVLNTDGEHKEAFNIIKTTQNSTGANAKLLATFQASGKVGIGTNTPTHEGLTVEKELTIKTRQVVTTLSTSEITTSLVADSTGLVKEVVAAPVPLGGIIMWSGTISNIPAGWTLCNGSGGANNVTVPDLTDRFIVGATADGAGNGYPGLEGSATGGSANAVLISHEHNLTINQTTHGHPFKTSHEQGGRHDRTGFPNTDSTGPFHTHPANTGAPTTMQNSSAGNAIGGSQANILASSRADMFGITAAGSSSNNQTGANANLPPYYALAFIIYVGA